MMHMVERSKDIRDIYIIDWKERKQYRLISMSYDVFINFKLLIIRFIEVNFDLFR